MNREKKALTHLLEQVTQARLDVEIDLRLLEGMLRDEQNPDLIAMCNKRIEELAAALTMLINKERMIEGMTHAEENTTQGKKESRKPARSRHDHTRSN